MLANETSSQSPAAAYAGATESKVQRLIRRVDPGFLVVLAISLIALWPFISRASLPEGTDAELHIFRLAELSSLLRGGEIFPRWAPDFYHGYGYPIFNYYAPLTYYLAFLVEILPRLDPVAGIKAVFILGMLAAAFGMYGFVRDNWGRRAGYVAAAVFLYAPYIQYIDPHARGVLPESFSFGVFALALWSLDRLWRSGGRWPWLAGICLVAGVILAHNLMGLLFFAMLAAWAAWRVLLTTQAEQRARKGALLAAALLLALALAAIFWLPVFLERDLVNLNTLIGEQDNYDFHNHFLALRQLFAPSLRLDWGASEPDFRFNLGIAQWLLGGLGILLLLLGKVAQPRHLSFFVLALAALLLMMLPASTVVWETIPFLPYFQFPWRMLGAAAAMLAVLAGAGSAALLERLNGRAAGWRERAAWVTASLVALPLLLGLPLSQPAPWPDFGPVTMLRMTLIENTGRWLGTTSTADYVPVTVETMPKREGSVVSAFGTGERLDRVNDGMLPDNAEITSSYVSPLHTRYTLDTPRATRLRLYQFDFPGWQVFIDGQRVETELGRPEGLLVIPVPAGEHTIDVRFGSTPARTIGALITLAALVATGVIAWRLPRSPQNDPRIPAIWPFGDAPVLLSTLLITAVFIFVLQPAGILHYHSQGNYAQPAQNQTFANFGGQIALIGYDAPAQQLSAGDDLDATLYWKALQPLGINYQVFVHLLGPDGLVAQSDKINPGDFPTKRWPSDRYVRDEHLLRRPADLPPGSYELAVGLWVQNDGWRLPLVDSQGQQVGDRFKLMDLLVE